MGHVSRNSHTLAGWYANTYILSYLVDFKTFPRLSLLGGLLNVHYILTLSGGLLNVHYILTLSGGLLQAHYTHTWVAYFRHTAHTLGLPTTHTLHTHPWVAYYRYVTHTLG